MNHDRLMRRLREARPKAEAPGDHEALFAQIVAEPETLASPRLRPGARPGSWRGSVAAFSPVARSRWRASPRLCSP